jgi:2-methylcitrate dehydratase PrpD
VVDACLALMTEHGFAGAEVKRVEAAVPPLTHRLVGRPPLDDMQPNYARLCGAYVAACALRRGCVGLDDFSSAALRHADTLALARRISIQTDGSGDPNALVPVTVSVQLEEGERFVRTLDVVYGSPDKPMSREAHLGKFRGNCAASAEPIAQDKVEQAIAAVETLERCADVRGAIDLLRPLG